MKKTSKADYDNSVHLGMIETKKVIREAKPLTFGESGYRSLGAMLDDHITNAIKNGDELQSVTFHFAEEQYNRIAEYYQPSNSIGIDD